MATKAPFRPFHHRLDWIGVALRRHLNILRKRTVWSYLSRISGFSSISGIIRMEWYHGSEKRRVFL